MNLELEALMGCVCFNTRNAARAVTRFYDDALASTGLKVTQLAILLVIRVNGAVTMQTLAATLGLNPSTLTRTLQPLDNGGFLQIEEGADRRKREVVLSAKGHRTLEQAFELWEQAQRDIRKRLGAARHDRIVGDMLALTTALKK